MNYKHDPFTSTKTCRRCHTVYPLACFGVRPDDRVSIFCACCSRLHRLQEGRAWCEVCETFQERRFHFNRYGDDGVLRPSPMCQACHREHGLPPDTDTAAADMTQEVTR